MSYSIDGSACFAATNVRFFKHYIWNKAHEDSTGKLKVLHMSLTSAHIISTWQELYCTTVTYMQKWSGSTLIHWLTQCSNPLLYRVLKNCVYVNIRLLLCTCNHMWISCLLDRASLWYLKNKRPTWCRLPFYFTSYVLNTFWTLIQGPPKKCIHTLMKENSMLYDRLL